MNTAYVEDTFEYFKVAWLAMSFGRFILLLLTIKYLKVTKIFLYWGLVMELIVQIGFPMDTGVFGSDFLATSNLVAFVLEYFSFWPSTIAVITV